MSEQKTRRMDTDDVLSSIRRLISQGEAPALRPARSPAVRNRLYLAPELRVDGGPGTICVKETGPEEPISIAFLGHSDSLRLAEEPAPETETEGRLREDMPKEAVADPNGVDPMPVLRLDDPLPAAQEAPPAPPAETSPEQAEDFDVIDEDMLRDFIAEIVRQELHGIAGDEMSGQLREVVQQEIRHALAAHRPGRD